jgi:undecaprenyl-diphosphatase
MSLIQSLILGIIQGITEFLPISSSAHLVLVPFLFNWAIPENQVFPFDVLVQLGTLAAVILYFWKDLWKIIKAFVTGLIRRQPFAEEDARMGWYLLLATLPAGLAGIFLKDRVEAAFNNPRLTAFFLFVTAIFLVGAEFFGRRSRQLDKMTWKDALWVGVFQAFSIFPGVSRSGSTIAGGMTRNFKRPAAARFAFLMSIPIMLAAGIFSLPDLFAVPDLPAFLPFVLVGFIAAGVVGYLSIRWLLSFLVKRSLIIFAVYCILLGSTVLIISGIRQTSPNVAGAAPGAPAAESAEFPPQTPISIQETLPLEISPALGWLRPRISACADAIPGLALVTEGAFSASGEPMQLSWGEPPNLKEKAVVFGEDDLVFIVNPRNPLRELPFALLQPLLSGELNSWGEVQVACPECFSAGQLDELIDQPVGVLLYPSNVDARRVMDEALSVAPVRPNSSSVLVPSPEQMKQEVSATLNAFGTLPSRAVDETVKVIPIQNGAETLKITRPLLAISAAESQPLTLQLLTCLQAAITP